jgi:hypothetical protein
MLNALFMWRCWGGHVKRGPHFDAQGVELIQSPALRGVSVATQKLCTTCQLCQASVPVLLVLQVWNIRYAGIYCSWDSVLR